MGVNDVSPADSRTGMLPENCRTKTIGPRRSRGEEMRAALTVGTAP